MSRLGRIIEAPLRSFDNKNRELVLRFRLWKHRWFPYRTAELIKIDGSFFSEEHELNLAPWKWHPPDNWYRFKEAIDRELKLWRNDPW